jgi:hydrolase, P-loop family
MRMAVFISHSAKETITFAEEYARSLKGGDVVLLNGDMGAGKTVFAKGVALGLGIKEEVLSPTYAYMNDYDGKLYHYDCYRLSSGMQAEALGLCDYFYGNGVCLVEWAENIADVLPENCKRVTINKREGDVREIIY